MRLTLIVPGLTARSPAALANASALSRYARHADDGTIVREGLAHAIVAAAGLPFAAPVAPLLALGAGADPGTDYVLAADPVTLVAGRDDVVLAGRVDDLSADEAAVLIAALDAHFATDALVFAAPRPSTWFARTPRNPVLVTTPLDVAMGRPIFPHLPGGADGKSWQRWQNEIQMLLFEHPVNVAREARGAAPVTGLWFWGGGRLADVKPAAGVVAIVAANASDDLVRGLARLEGQVGAALPATLDDTLARSPGAEAMLVALPPLVDDAGVTTLCERWVGPATTALARGALAALDIVGDGNGIVARWHAQRQPALTRLAARWRNARFAVPAPTAE